MPFLPSSSSTPCAFKSLRIWSALAKSLSAFACLRASMNASISLSLNPVVSPTFACKKSTGLSCKILSGCAKSFSNIDNASAWALPSAVSRLTALLISRARLNYTLTAPALLKSSHMAWLKGVLKGVLSISPADSVRLSTDFKAWYRRVRLVWASLSALSEKFTGLR